jgi:hypothetical protein
MKTVTITTKAWQPVGVPVPAGGLHTEAGARALVYTDLDLRGNKYELVGLAIVTLHLQDNTDLPTTKGSTDEHQQPEKSV